MVSPLKCLLASALVVSCVNAHGWLSKPAATFSNEAGDKSQFIATIEASSSGFKGTFNTAPADNVASFTKAFDASTYKSLKAFIDDKAKITVTGATLTCGNAEPDATAQPLPAKLEWYHSETKASQLRTKVRARPGATKSACSTMRTALPTSLLLRLKCRTRRPSARVRVRLPFTGWPCTDRPGRLSVNSTTGSSSADTPSVTPAPASGSSPSVTPAPASGGSPSTPSTNTSPSTSTTSAPSTSTTDESDCGSYDVAGSDEDCGSYDVAGGSADEGQDTTQTSTVATRTSRVRPPLVATLTSRAQQSLAVTPTSKARRTPAKTPRSGRIPAETTSGRTGCWVAAESVPGYGHWFAEQFRLQHFPGHDECWYSGAAVHCLFASALAVTVVNGHGYMTDPKVKFTPQAGDPTQFVGSIEASASGFSGTFNGAPKDNVAAFTKAFGSSKYKSLKEYVIDKAKIIVTGATLTCGSCDPKQEPQPMPKSTVEWSHSDTEGFTPSHEGPCEVWCDDIRTFHDDDCAAHYTMVPAEMPFDRDACMGASTLTFYWMAMHSSSWQVYVNCAPLEKTASTGTKSKYAHSRTAHQVRPATLRPHRLPRHQRPLDPSETTTPSTPSTTTAPSPPSASTAPSTPSTTTAPTTDESDCGSYDLAGSDSDCGSYDVAGGPESDCGSYDVKGSESDCGSFDVAGSGDATQDAGSQTNFDFSTMQGAADAGTVAPYK
ncbi:hypothetical protein GQ600_16753 [Phytophthora cactorum]|nr:hypothetical protein GQ600_16753 [Phytophthora cactorum]